MRKCLLVIIISFVSNLLLFGQKINGLSYVASNDSVRWEYVKPIIDVHANYVTLMPYGYTTNKTNSKVEFNNKQQWFGEQVHGIHQYAKELQKNGIKIMLKPQLWIRGGFTGDLIMNTEEEWQSLETTYSKFILTYATTAEKIKAPIFCIGTELQQFVSLRPEYWSKLIKKIKKIYSGKLTYAANWDEFQQVPFWDQLDYIGIDAYFPLTEKESPSISDYEAGWLLHKEKIKKTHQKYGKPVLFTEFGYRSVNYAGKKPWDYSSTIGEVNFQAQSNGLQAIYNQFWNEHWFAGGFVWKWFMWHDRVGGLKDNRFTPQNKPAQELLSKLFKQ